MPGGDGTGPRGMGSMTGRGAGYCAGYGAPGYANAISGRGGWGRGGGRGRRNWFYATGMPGDARMAAGMPAWGMTPYAGAPVSRAVTPTADQELNALKDQAAQMESVLEGIRRRMQELESEHSGE